MNPVKASTKIYYRYEDRNCSGWALTVDNIPAKTEIHTNHGSCELEVEVQKSLTRLKALESDTQEPSGYVYKQRIADQISTNLRCGQIFQRKIQQDDESSDSDAKLHLPYRNVVLSELFTFHYRKKKKKKKSSKFSTFFNKSW